MLRGGWVDVEMGMGGCREWVGECFGVVRDDLSRKEGNWDMVKMYHS